METEQGFKSFKKLNLTLVFTSVKNTLTQMDIPLTDCRGQSYDGTSNMLGNKTGVANA